MKYFLWLAMKHFPPLTLILLSLGVAGYSVYVTTSRSLTALEGALLQIFILSVGLAGSFWFGRQSAVKAAREIIRPHARAAFRRLVSLYNSLSRVADAIKSVENSESVDDYRTALTRIDATVEGQLEMADDALEDWRDIAPEDVDELWTRRIPSEIRKDEGQENG